MCDASISQNSSARWSSIVQPYFRCLRRVQTVAIDHRRGRVSRNHTKGALNPVVDQLNMFPSTILLCFLLILSTTTAAPLSELFDALVKKQTEIKNKELLDFIRRSVPQGIEPPNPKIAEWVFCALSYFSIRSFPSLTNLFQIWNFQVWQIIQLHIRWKRKRCIPSVPPPPTIRHFPKAQSRRRNLTLKTYSLYGVQFDLAPFSLYIVCLS